jgi:arylsulfatase A-like enzyme
MRADRLGALGARPSPTPALDRFADGAQVFEQAIATAPYTMPSTASLMTGRYADKLGIRNHSVGDRLPADSPTIASLAQAAGYRTAAVVTNPWLARPSSGFRRAFDSFVSGRDDETEDTRHWRMSAERVADAAVEILRTERTGPLFLWVHFMDAHMPYAPGRYAGIEPAAQAGGTLEKFASEDFDRQQLFFSGSGPDDVETVRAAYDAAIRAIDTEISRILETVDDNDIVIVAADHGEALGEHGLFFAHDFTLYQELLHVPLIVRLPRGRATRIETPVSLLDVLPTLCASSALACPDALDGAPLPAAPDPRGARDLFSISAPARTKYDRCPFLERPGPAGRWSSIRRGDRKIIRIPMRDGVRYEAYDLGSDPGELRDTFDPRTDGQPAERLDRWFESQLAASDGSPVNGRADARTRRELRELGYLE